MNTMFLVSDKAVRLGFNKSVRLMFKTKFTNLR